MRFLLRVDDFGLSHREGERVPDKLPDVGCEIARRFHDAMSGLPYLAAVVPAALDEAGGAWIRSRPAGMTVALHGWDHSTRGTVHNEFHGLTMTEMRDKIAAGYKIVGGCKWFIPTFNACEEGLFEACWHESIRFVCGAPSYWPTPPQPWSVYRDVLFVPSWALTYGATGWQQGKNGPPPLLETVPMLLNLPGLAVLTLHVNWESAKDAEFKGVRALAEVLRGHVVTPEEFVRERR